MSRILIVLAIALSVASCGVETVGTAATAAALKQKELEEGKKTMAKAQQDIGKAMEQTQESAKKADDAEK